MRVTRVFYDRATELFVAEDCDLFCATGQLYKGSPPVAVPILIPTGKKEYLFPGESYSFEAGVILTRLESTRGGSAARWTASPDARGLYNDAPYEPYLRGWGLTRFRWTPPLYWEREGEARHPDNEFERPYTNKWVAYILQEGSQTPNWYAEFEGDEEPWLSAPDLPWEDAYPSHLERLFRAAFRAEVRANHDGIPDRKGSDEVCQGHLEAWPIEGPDIRPVFTRRLFLNHFSPAWWVSSQVTHEGRVFALAEVREGATVIARDHEPITLERGWYLLIHPAPDGEEVD